ncbi:LytTR family transcriptional regulator DNA-binding domain-containing protein [Muricauda sp. 2012CJ35-5]|uniref:LytTR family transcriptional regulator DNA-binding domain-containing protein n=1 Tax=Flagellimonas spongiicola TaxID=2942208 RepID=A0ABT0PMC3_9FLAO|nr:LytTR family transcriptional regulator DNA-binding domain-containing protein [Allomuricauda spongiicola]MCL6272523.1 LytTR family transcriptional regulator DNA-binding domain-containing protein [Allomuricauda spongiicola]
MVKDSARVKIIVVEDEILLANDIANRLRDNNYTITGIAASADNAMNLLSENPDVDIILIDIVLKGEHDGIELARMINESYDIPFLFLTSHSDDYLIERAKSVKPYAYLLKPFNDRQVCIAIELALKNFSNKTPEKDHLGKHEFSTNQNQVLQIKDSLFLKKNHYFERVPLQEILFLEADSNYCSVYTKTERFMYSVGLNKIEAQLPVDRFLRTHRSYVVNINSVKGFSGNMLYVGEMKVPVSKAHKEDVFKLFPTI